METDRREDARDLLDVAGTLYDKAGTFLAPCRVRDLSKAGVRLELFKETTLPRYFLLSLEADGSGRRLCSKMWQLAAIAGARFAESHEA